MLSFCINYFLFKLRLGSEIPWNFPGFFFIKSFKKNRFLKFYKICIFTFIKMFVYPQVVSKSKSKKRKKKSLMISFKIVYKIYIKISSEKFSDISILDWNIKDIWKNLSEILSNVCFKNCFFNNIFFFNKILNKFFQ